MQFTLARQCVCGAKRPSSRRGLPRCLVSSVVCNIFRLSRGKRNAIVANVVFCFPYARSCFSPFWTFANLRAENGKNSALPLWNKSSRKFQWPSSARKTRSLPDIVARQSFVLINRDTRFVVKIKSERRNENLTWPFLNARVAGTFPAETLLSELSPCTQLLSLFSCVRIFISSLYSSRL